MRIPQFVVFCKNPNRVKSYVSFTLFRRPTAAFQAKIIMGRAWRLKEKSKVEGTWELHKTSTRRSSVPSELTRGQKACNYLSHGCWYPIKRVEGSFTGD